MKLKSIVAIMFTLPTIAFAGTTCYEATSWVPSTLPSRLCLESIEASYDVTSIIVKSADRSLPPVLNITSTIRHTEDRLKFSSEATLLDYWMSGCGDGLKAKVVVKGEIQTGDIYAQGLDVSVETLSTNDTCHSRPQLDVVKYELVK